MLLSQTPALKYPPPRAGGRQEATDKDKGGGAKVMNKASKDNRFHDKGKI